MKKNICKPLFPSVITLIIMIVFIAPPSGAAPATFNVIYPYGIQHSDDPALGNMYNSWVSWFVTGSGANGYHRTAYPEGLACAGAGATSSQGLGYAMLLAVWFGDQFTFNELWNYKTTVSPKLGLMASCVNSGGGVVDQNSASDADADIAMALLLAHRRWGDAGAINYGALATTEINKLASNEICPSDFSVYPGDFCSCTSDDNPYPGYFTPAWYTEFGYQTGNPAFWDSVKTKAYSMLASSRNAVTGLDTERISFGSGMPIGSQDGYDSARIPWRYSLDYAWHGDGYSLVQITLDSGFFMGNSGSVCAVYDIHGTCVDAAYSGHRIGPAGTSMMIAGKAAELTSYYDASKAAFNSSAGSNYYDTTIALLSMLQMTGNFPKVFGGTPTPPCCIGPCGCGDMFEDGDDGDDRNNWGGMWYTYYDRGPVNYGTSYVVPCPVSFYTQAGLTPVPFYMQAPGLSLTPGIPPGYSARMTGYVTTVYTYGFLGMGTGTNKDSARPSFTPKDVSMYTGIRFLVKSSSNTDMYDFKVLCAGSVTNTGGNDYKFTFTPHTNTTLVDIPFSVLTQAVGWGTPVSLPLVLQNMTDLQWQTNGQPKPAVDLWVDDIAFYPQKPPTPTATYCPGEKFDGFEDDNEQNLFGGDWYTYESVSSTVYPVAGSLFTPGAPGANGSFFAGRMFGTIVNQAGEFAGMGSDLNASGTGRNMLAFVGVSFWAKGDGNWYSVKLKAAPAINTGGNDYKYTFKPDLGWSQFTVPFALFTQEGGWGIAVNLVTVLVNLKELQFESKGINRSMDLWVDDIVFNCSQNWTPTVTPTKTITETVLPTFTGTPTQDETETPVVTGTKTQLPATETPVVSGTETPVITDTPTREDTAIPSATETEAILSETATAGETGTGTQQPSFTDTPLPADTGTPAATETQQPATLTATLTETQFIVPSNTFTQTCTASPFATPTITPVFDKPALTGHITYPNPSAGDAVTFRYSHSGYIDKVRISIFTLDARKIAEINDAKKAPGDSETVWNTGIKPANGLYYYALELTGREGTVIRKNDILVILRR